MNEWKPRLTWKDRIKKAQKAGFFTDDDKVKAREWGSCAMSDYGRQAEPQDAQLFTLGWEFQKAVKNNWIERAKEYHERIRKRCRLLKGEY